MRWEGRPKCQAGQGRDGQRDAPVPASWRGGRGEGRVDAGAGADVDADAPLEGRRYVCYTLIRGKGSDGAGARDRGAGATRDRVYRSSGGRAQLQLDGSRKVEGRDEVVLRR